MQAMHDLLRSSLAASLSALSPLDRLGAAWPVVAGHAVAERSAVTAFADGTVTITADTPAWQNQLTVMRGQLRSDLARVSRVPLTDILFLVPSLSKPATGSTQVQPGARGKAPMTQSLAPTEIPAVRDSARPATVTLDEVRHVAALANLQLTADEEPRMQHDLNAILEHIAALSTLDTTDIPAMSQVGELLAEGPNLAGATLRQDEPKASVDRAAVMQEAPETDGRFFKVPKVIER